MTFFHASKGVKLRLMGVKPKYVANVTLLNPYAKRLSREGRLFRDDASELPPHLRLGVDGIVVASPIYPSITASPRTVMQHLCLLTNYDNTVPSVAILTTNRQQKNCEVWTRLRIDAIVGFFSRELYTPMGTIHTYNT